VITRELILADKTLNKIIDPKTGKFKLSHKALLPKPEGYVAIDKLTGGALKIVDQLEFSANNFDADVLKGWQR
jgi:hypothetical protein